MSRTRLAVVTAVGLVAVSGAVFFARRLARPLGDISRAARRIAQGDYRARVPREGPEELVGGVHHVEDMRCQLQDRPRTSASADHRNGLRSGVLLAAGAYRQPEKEDAEDTGEEHDHTPHFGREV